MRKLFILFFILFIFAGCDNKKKPEELFKETASGVVVVLNEFYYEMTFPNGKSLYFKGLDSNGDIEGVTADAEEAMRNRNVITGTAFFVGEDGMMMTNRHVAQPDIDAVTARRSMMRIMKTLKQFLAVQMSDLLRQYFQLEEQKKSCTYIDHYGFVRTDQQMLEQISMQQAELDRQYTELNQTSESIDDNIDPEGIKVRTVCQLGIAYDNSYVTSYNDFIEKNPCVVVRVSDKESVDLALLQLKNKTTPESSYVFKLKDEKSGGNGILSLFSGGDDDEGLKIDQQLYMIGYNAGLVLANTKQGIKVQMTSGRVTQMSDGQRLLYSIPALQGSSGSPVVDEYGNLVAVNFAKLGTTDSFNFGIPYEAIREFMKK